MTYLTMTLAIYTALLMVAVTFWAGSWLIEKVKKCLPYRYTRGGKKLWGWE